jgi:hypothetical protein
MTRSGAGELRWGRSARLAAEPAKRGLEVGRARQILGLWKKGMRVVLMKFRRAEVA